MIATATPEDLRADPRSAGRPVRGCDIRILDEDGTELAPGEVGQIAVLNGTPFDGYTHGGGKDSLDGYMLTGDLGRLDAAGRLTVEGRVDDMIISRRRERLSRRGRGGARPRTRPSSRPR